MPTIYEMLSNYTVRYLCRGTRENFFESIEKGYIRNPVKLNVDVYLDQNGKLCLIPSEEDK